MLEFYYVLSPKICVPKEIKGNNAEAFHMITNKDEAEVMGKPISCDCKWKFNSTSCNSKQKRVNGNAKIIVRAKKMQSYVFVRIVTI